MNVHPDTLFNTLIHNTREATPSILASVSLDTEDVHIQMEDLNQDIQDATFGFIVRTPTPKQISSILLITKPSTSRYSSILTTPILNLRLPKTISLLF